MRQRDSPASHSPFQQSATSSAQLEPQGTTDLARPLNQTTKVLTHGLTPHAHVSIDVVQTYIRERRKEVVLDKEEQQVALALGKAQALLGSRQRCFAPLNRWLLSERSPYHPVLRGGDILKHLQHERRELTMVHVMLRLLECPVVRAPVLCDLSGEREGGERGERPAQV